MFALLNNSKLADEENKILRTSGSLDYPILTNTQITIEMATTKLETMVVELIQLLLWTS